MIDLPLVSSLRNAEQEASLSSNRLSIAQNNNQLDKIDMSKTAYSIASPTLLAVNETIFSEVQQTGTLSLDTINDIRQVTAGMQQQMALGAQQNGVDAQIASEAIAGVVKEVEDQISFYQTASAATVKQVQDIATLQFYGSIPQGFWGFFSGAVSDEKAKDTARDVYKQETGVKDLKVGEPALEVIFVGGKQHLAWKVEVREMVAPDEIEMGAYLYIDACTGTVLQVFGF